MTDEEVFELQEKRTLTLIPAAELISKIQDDAEKTTIKAWLGAVSEILNDSPEIQKVLNTDLSDLHTFGSVES